MKNIVKYAKWPYRLVVRTTRFQCVNTGSIPVRATIMKIKKSPVIGDKIFLI